MRVDSKALTSAVVILARYSFNTLEHQDAACENTQRIQSNVSIHWHLSFVAPAEFRLQKLQVSLRGSVLKWLIRWPSFRREFFHGSANDVAFRLLYIHKWQFGNRSKMPSCIHPRCRSPCGSIVVCFWVSEVACALKPRRTISQCGASASESINSKHVILRSS